VTELVQVINGGNNFGTWMHEDVALVFVQWLSPGSISGVIKELRT